MLGALLDALRQRGLVREVETMVREMLDMAQTSFRAGALAFLEQRPVHFDMYLQDREINLRVVEVRKKVVEHLAVHRQADFVGELVLITVINDVERIGDFSKNLLEVSRKLGEVPDAPRYIDKLAEMRADLEQHFPDAKLALLDGDREAGERVIDNHDRVNAGCEALINELFSDQELSTRHAIGLVLATRYFKRVSSHLKNVGTTAVNPFILVGYRQLPETESSG